MSKKLSPFSWQFPIGMMAGVVALVVVLQVTKIATERNYADSIASESPALLALMIAFVSLLVSFKMFTEQRRMRQAGTDPVVLVHLGKRSDEPMMVTLNISNVGAGAAMNVTVKADTTNLPDLTDRVVTHPDKIGHPIRVIPQNESVAYSFGVGWQLLGDDPLPPFEVEIYYEDIEGVSHQETMTIDVNELSWQSANAPPAASSAKSLAKIESHLKTLLNSKSAYEVITETRSENIARKDFEREKSFSI